MKRGHPLKGPVKKKHVSIAKILLFLQGLTRPPARTLALPPFLPPYFLLAFGSGLILIRTSHPSGSRSNYCLLLELALSTVFPFLLRCQVTLVRARKSYRSLNINVSSKRNIFHNCFFKSFFIPA